jgi:hypothetical protein
MLQEFQKIRCGQKLCWWKEEFVFLCGLAALRKIISRKDAKNAKIPEMLTQ